MFAETFAASVRPTYESETRVDIALLASALFLQRFSLSFGHSILSLNLVPAALIFIHQFASGRLLIQYDRLLWFLVLGLAATSSLLLNFNSTMLSSYSLFLAMYSLFTFSRPSTTDRYKSTLQGFQFLVLILSYLGIVQFAAQFVVDGRQLIQFFGIFPEFLFAEANKGLANTIIPITSGSSLIKSNGILFRGTVDHVANGGSWHPGRGSGISSPAIPFPARARLAAVLQRNGDHDTSSLSSAGGSCQ